MFREYAIDPEVVGSNWKDCRYLAEKFGFDKGRLISDFPEDNWLAHAYKASADLKPMEKSKVILWLENIKRTKLVKSNRNYDSCMGWIQNVIKQQNASSPFHAVITKETKNNHDSIIEIDKVDEGHPLMDSPTVWNVPRTGNHIAAAIEPMLRSARVLLFIDRYFDVENLKYQETLRSCLKITGNKQVRCEIHFCDRKETPPINIIAKRSRNWSSNVIPNGRSISLSKWTEHKNGEDFHARYLITDIGGINIESGFSAEGEHQKVQLSILPIDFSKEIRKKLAPRSKVYNSVGRTAVIDSKGKFYFKGTNNYKV